ncbi:aminopeptidase P family N-terminal domain-containing protein [Mesorhizobium sp. NZP2298]|uniref:aminopeptidase P family N-terminal domain-containing protein n=1 Tax=Mesorhizobium sp. NZP2298 TaxID=2483403 RepID=UPI0030EF5802
MVRQDIEALVVSSLANIAYLTGSIVRHSGPQGLVISIRKEEPTFIVRRADFAAAIYQTYLERDNLIVSPETGWPPLTLMVTTR